MNNHDKFNWKPLKVVSIGVPIKSILLRNNTDVTLGKEEVFEAAKTSVYWIVCYKHPKKAKVTKWCNIIIWATCAKKLDTCPYKCNKSKFINSIIEIIFLFLHISL